MEQNRVVVMLDEELVRLRQVRAILQGLMEGEADTASLLLAARPGTAPEEITKEATLNAPEVGATLTSVPRHISRRGIATGRRGPRLAKHAEVALRPLDAAVPKAPVVVSRSALLANKPVMVAPPPQAAEGTLEAWVQSLKQAIPAA